jgi:hypothetical protein
MVACRCTLEVDSGRGYMMASIVCTIVQDTGGVCHAMLTCAITHCSQCLMTGKSL